jgi:2-hydroxy-3-oxopropionate reductase
MVKDLGTAVAAARSAGLTLTVTDAVLAQNEALVAEGYAQGDNANLMRLYNQVP